MMNERFEKENNIPVFAEFSKELGKYINTNDSELGILFRLRKTEDLNRKFSKYKRRTHEPS